MLREWELVDGYNLLNAGPFLKNSDLARAREDMLEMLADYAGYFGGLVTVVFDAHLIRGGREKRDVYLGLDVVYTREGETADNFIERTVPVLVGRGYRVRVVTSDALEQVMVLARGAERVSAREYLRHVSALRRRGQTAYTGRSRGQRLDQRIDPSVVEKLRDLRDGE